MVYVGIDVGGTGIKIGVVNEAGEILSQGETPTLVGRPYEEIVRDMGQCTLQVLAEGGFQEADVGAIGIGIPGVADNKTGTVIFCTNMHWRDVPLRSELQKYLNKPVIIDNDATVAGLAEYVCGVSAGTSSSVFITLGTGLGGGIMLNGRPWSGAHGVGSEIGHIPMDIDGEPCTCGNFGCLERYCSATAVIRMGKQALLEHPESRMNALCGGDAQRLTAKTVFDAAKEGDEVALGVFHRYADYLAQAMDLIIAFLDPEMIVLGGGLSKAGHFLVDAVKERLPRYLLYKTLPYSRVELAKLGPEAGVIGAAMLGKQFLQGGFEK